MFEFSEWAVAGILDGYKNGLTPFSKVTELTSKYLMAGIITQAQADDIKHKCPAPTESEV